MLDCTEVPLEFEPSELELDVESLDEELLELELDELLVLPVALESASVDEVELIEAVVAAKRPPSPRRDATATATVARRARLLPSCRTFMIRRLPVPESALRMTRSPMRFL